MDQNNGQHPTDNWGDPDGAAAISQILRNPRLTVPQVRQKTPEEVAQEAAEAEAQKKRFDEWEKQRALDAQESEKRQRGCALRDLHREIGGKYIKTLKEWEFYGTTEEQSRQRVIVDRVKGYGRNLEDHMQTGTNALFVGSRGTGKDLCLSNVLGHAIQGHGFKVKWQNGLDLFARIRNTMRKDAGESESHIVKSLSTADLLALSDPIPQTGSVSDFQMSTLYCIVDYRYRHMKPTLITMNVASRAEAEEKLGALIVDRLFHDAEIFFHDWPSYRQFDAARKAAERKDGAA